MPQADKHRANSTEIKGEEYAINRYYHSAAAGTPFEAILNPEYWTHVARGKQVRDRITAECADNSWYAELVVVEATPLYLIVKALPGYPINLFEDKAEAPEKMNNRKNYKVDFTPIDKWRVVNKVDNSIVAKDFADKGAADRHLTDHLAALEK